VQNEWEQDEIVHDPKGRDRKIERFERIQAEDYGRRPQPNRSMRVSEREPQNPEVHGCQAPKSH
jgi:hypothetical protein